MYRFFFIVSLLYVNASFSQLYFHGIAKYRLMVDGSAESKTDSMTVVFGKNKIKTIFYFLSENGSVVQNEYIDDIAEKMTYTINPQLKSYSKSPMKTEDPFSFKNKYSYNSVLNNLCLLYSSDDIRNFNADYNNAECYAGIDFMYDDVRNYFFYGVQPLIIDNRIILEYRVYQSNGMIQKVELTEINKLDETDPFFDLQGFTEKFNQ